GLTDVPTMKLVKESGGSSIAVYPAGGEAVAHQLMSAGRINYFVPADYRAHSPLFVLVRTILEKLRAENILAQETAKMAKAAQSPC
ncbi:MAG TPA: haloacid dehalogenase-like hydrolase, partial [Sphaerochaeta sp.]|nr:haloacid dehalogenase-like hydrolase [Sphaerochaeta sp.]